MGWPSNVGVPAIGLILASCAVGPHYVAPQTPSEARGPFVSASPATAANQPPPPDWWRLYDDPVLDRLVGEALVENQDLKVAAANLAYAQALVEESRAGLFPTTDLSAGAAYGKSAQTSALAAALGQPLPKAQWGYSAGVNVAYEVDLFGRIRRTIEAARANAEAVQDAENVVRITVAAETAGAYANVCAYAEQAAVARRSLTSAEQAYEIISSEHEVGAASDLDLARQATILDQTRATVPTLDGQRRAALFELAALLGKPPVDLPTDAAGCTSPPQLRQPLPVGDGAALLRRRPDVREAERQLAAATARIGLSTADLFPTVSLVGSGGSNASSISGLGSAQAFSFAVGPMMTWSFPNVSVALAHIHEARAQTSAALASFNSVVLQALKETEQALTTYAAELGRHGDLVAASGHAAEAYRLAQVQYRAGSISFLDLLQAETTLIAADQALAVSNQQISADQVAVFQALGGGWETAPAVTAPAAPR